MSVRELAPALLALADLFDEMQQIAMPGDGRLSLEITATEQGSFVVDLLLSTPDRLTNLFASNPATALANLQALVIGARTGVLSLMKQLRGRLVVSSEPMEPGIIRLNLDDGSHVETSVAAFAGANRLTVRKSISEVVRPLLVEGVDSLGFERTETEETTVEITRDDVPFMGALPPSEDTRSTDSQMILEVVAPAFDGGRWRVSDGGSTFWAEIADESFAARIEAGTEAFAAGDRLDCKVRIDQRTVDGKLSIQRSILEVTDHSPKERPPDQLRLDAKGQLRTAADDVNEYSAPRATEDDDDTPFGLLPPSVD